MIGIIPAKQGGVILVDIPEPQYDNEVKGYGHEYVGKLEGGKLDGPFKESQTKKEASALYNPVKDFTDVFFPVLKDVTDKIVS